MIKHTFLYRLTAALLTIMMIAGAPSAFASEEDSGLGDIPVPIWADPENRVRPDPIPLESFLPYLPVRTEPPAITLMPVETLRPIETLQPIEPAPIPVEPTAIPIVPDPVFPVPEPGRTVIFGDMNRDGTLDSYDAARLLRYLAGVDPYLFLRADANGDGFVDVRDVYFILTAPEKQWRTYFEPANILYKPVIYLYPEETTDVTVTLGRPDALTCVYPAYNGGWTVTAQPDGTLTGPTGREYYALYYEADMNLPDEPEEGFVIARDHVADFLEQKLAILGLTEREAEEMIIYWLPQLTKNEYVFIRFAPEETTAEAMPLDVSPAPDTVIRVWMLWRALDEFIDVPAQELAPVSRAGFTVVECGGFELPS